MTFAAFDLAKSGVYRVQDFVVSAFQIVHLQNVKIESLADVTSKCSSYPKNN